MGKKVARGEDQEYQLKYITLCDIEDLERRHPLVHEAFPNFSFETLKTCPDVTDDFPCFFYLVSADNKIVSSVAYIHDTLSVEGKEYPWAWAGSLLTHPAYRGRGLATILIREAVKILHQQGFAWGGVFSTDAAVNIYQKLNFTMPGYADRYLMLKSARPFLQAHLKLRIISHILDLLSRPIISLIFQYIYRKRKLNTLSAKIDKISLDDDKYLKNSFPELCYQNKFHFNDSAPKLYWKIKMSNAKYENDSSLYLLKETSTDKPLCYFVIRMKHQLKPLAYKYKDFKLMTLMDFGFYKNDIRIYSTLLKKIISLFWYSNAEVLEIISNSEILGTLMRRLGMIKIGKGMSFKFSVPKNWTLAEEYKELQNWHLTHFCGDGFSF